MVNNLLENKDLRKELGNLYQDIINKIMVSDNHEEIWKLSNIKVNTELEVYEDITGQAYLEEIAKLDKNNKEDIFIWRDAFVLYYKNYEIWDARYKLDKILKEGSLTDIVKHIVEQARLECGDAYNYMAAIEGIYDNDEKVIQKLKFWIKLAIEKIEERFPEDKKAQKIIQIFKNENIKLDLRIMAAYAAVSR